MSEKGLLHEGEILTGPLFREPMRAETVRANGPGTWAAGLAGMRDDPRARAVGFPMFLDSIADLRRECPHVSVDTIRKVSKDLRSKKQVHCLGRGQGAQWRKTEQWQLGNTQSNGY